MATEAMPLVRVTGPVRSLVHVYFQLFTSQLSQDREPAKTGASNPTDTSFDRYQKITVIN
jgi:hypothetical protein